MNPWIEILKSIQSLHLEIQPLYLEQPSFEQVNLQNFIKCSRNACSVPTVKWLVNVDCTTCSAQWSIPYLWLLFRKGFLNTSSSEIITEMFGVTVTFGDAEGVPLSFASLPFSLPSENLMRLLRSFKKEAGAYLDESTAAQLDVMLSPAPKPLPGKTISPVTRTLGTDSISMITVKRCTMDDPNLSSVNDFSANCPLPASRRSATTWPAASGFALRQTAPGPVWNGNRRLICISCITSEGVKRPRALPSISPTDYFSSPHACLKSAYVLMHSITIHYPFCEGVHMQELSYAHPLVHWALFKF